VEAILFQGNLLPCGQGCFQGCSEMLQDSVHYRIDRKRERERERERLLWRPVHLIRIQLGHRSGTVRQLPHRLLSHSSIASAFVIIIIISLLLPSSFSPKGMRRLGSTHCVHVVLLIDSLLFSFFSPSSVYSPLFFFFFFFFFFSFLLSFFLDSV